MGKRMLAALPFLAALVLLPACVSRESYMRATNALGNTEEALQELKRYQAQIEGRNRALRRQVDELSAKVIPGTDREKLKKLLEELRGPAPQKNDGWSTYRGKLIYTMEGKVLFPSGSAALTQGGEQLIRSVVPKLKERAVRIQVRGHTDADPIKKSQWKDNMDLSLARAYAVWRLLARAGYPRDKMEVAGFGSGEPVSEGKTEDDKQRNRRVEILIVEVKE